MKPTETFLNIFLAMALGSLAESPSSILHEGWKLEYWAFSIFFASLRIKFYLDDCKDIPNESNRLGDIDSPADDVADELYNKPGVMVSTDSSHNEKSNKIDANFQKEFFLGILAWFFWIFSAASLSRSVAMACFILVVAISIATIALFCFRGKKQKIISSSPMDQKRNQMMGFNLVYIFFLLLSGAAAWVGEHTNFSSFNSACFVLLLISTFIVIFDYKKTESSI